MLSRADADLVARDPGLPGLAMLLESDAFRETLQRALPDRRLGAVQFDYVRYKPGTNCLSAFTLNLGGTAVRGYAKAYQPDDWRKLGKAERRPTVAGPLGPGRLILQDESVEIAIFPNDNKLKVLGRLFDEVAGPKLLAHVFPDRPDLQAGTLNYVRYKPERRFVARLDTGGEPRAILKLYTERAYAAAWTAAETLDAAGLIGHSSHPGVLAFAWRHGAPLTDSINGPEPSLATVGRVGAALAEFHSRDGSLLIRDRDTELSTIQATVEGLGILHPPIVRLAGALVRRLTHGLYHAPAIQRPIHGDFYDRQVLVQDDRIAILDLDEAVISDPAADLGLFIAHLERDALRGELPESRVAPVRDALLAGYGQLPEQVDLYTAVGLLQLAPHHFRNREPDWPERTEATLERALNIVCRQVASRV